MFFSVVKWTIISLTLIFLFHHLYTFLLNTLTVPKIKDLVNKPKEQYNDILHTMLSNQDKQSNQDRQDKQDKQDKQSNQDRQDRQDRQDKQSNQDRQDKQDRQDRQDKQDRQSNSMTDELSSFLNDLKKKGGVNNTAYANISSASDFNSSSAFSNF